MKYNLNTYSCLQLNNCAFAIKKPKKTIMDLSVRMTFLIFFIVTGHWDSVELQGSWVKTFPKINFEKFRDVLWNVWPQNALNKIKYSAFTPSLPLPLDVLSRARETCAPMEWQGEILPIQHSKGCSVWSENLCWLPQGWACLLLCLCNSSCGGVFLLCWVGKPSNAYA